MPEEEGEAGWDELYVNYFPAPSEQPWRPQGDGSPRKVWSDGAKSPNQDRACQDPSALWRRAGSAWGGRTRWPAWAECQGPGNGLRGPFNS